MAGVSHEVVEPQAFCQSFAFGFAALSKLAYGAAALITVFWKPDLSLLLKGSDDFTNLEAFREICLNQKGE